MSDEQSNATPVASTAPNNISYQLKGFADEETPKKLANYMNGFVQYIGKTINLERLDGFTIAYDYPQALLDLDRGYETSFILAPTTELATGVAMSPMVMRDGVVKTHIVFNANTFIHFLNEEHEGWPWLFYQLAHECGHVHDHRAFDVALPGIMLTPYDFGDDLTNQIYQLGSCSWAEYAASRLSAEFNIKQVEHYEETFFTVLEGLDDRIAQVMETFLDDHDGWKCYRSLSGEYERMLKFTSYLLGHIAAFENGLELAPKFKEFRESDHWLAEYIADLDETLEEIWAKYGKWESIDDFEGIGQLILLLLARQKMYLYLQNGELMLNIE